MNITPKGSRFDGAVCVAIGFPVLLVAFAMVAVLAVPLAAGRICLELYHEVRNSA